MSVANKLSYLGETKEQIREGLNKLGGNISKNDTFRSYADKINEIYDSMPKVEETDVESATLEGTIKGGLTINLKGNTSQTGTPTPSSPIDVNVVSGDNEVVVCGENLWSSEWEQGNVNASGNNEASSILIRTKGYINVIPEQHYAITRSITGDYVNVRGYDKNKNFVGTGGNVINLITGNTANNPMIQTQNNCVIAPKDNIYYLRFNDATNNLNTQYMMVKGDTIPTTYEPYQSQTYEVDLPVENLVNSVEYNKYCSGSGNVTSGNTDYLGINDFASCKPNTTYTISFQHDNSSGQLYVAYKDSSNNFISRENYSTNRTFTTPNNAYYLYAYIYKSSTFTTIGGWVQLEKGSKANHYTPYGTTPIELNKIGTYKEYFTKNSGKNLCDIVLDGTLGNTIQTKQFTLKPNTNYTISTNTYLGSPINSANIFATSGTTITPSTSTNGVNGSKTITSDSNGNIIVAYRNYEQTLNYSSGNYYVQINEGSIALPYEPYGTGLWCKYNAIEKKVFDGSETGWAYINSTFRINVPELMLSNYDMVKQVSNYYQGITYNSSWASYNYFICYTTDSNFVIKNIDITSLDDFKTWLGTHNTEIYYILQTPYLSLIEDNNLIEQLDNLQNAMSYKGTTNINQINNDLPFKLDVKAILDWRN